MRTIKIKFRTDDNQYILGTYSLLLLVVDEVLLVLVSLLEDTFIRLISDDDELAAEPLDPAKRLERWSVLCPFISDDTVFDAAADVDVDDDE